MGHELGFFKNLLFYILPDATDRPWFSPGMACGEPIELARRTRVHER